MESNKLSCKKFSLKEAYNNFRLHLKTQLICIRIILSNLNEFDFTDEKVTATKDVLGKNSTI